VKQLSSLQIFGTINHYTDSERIGFFAYSFILKEFGISALGTPQGVFLTIDRSEVMIGFPLRCIW